MQRHTGPLSGERAATRIAWYKHARSIPAFSPHTADEDLCAGFYRPDLKATRMQP
jgi:hypothetical protein